MQRLLLPPLLLLAFPSPAQEPRGAESLETVVVTATRTERPIEDVPATVSLITAEDLERQLARDIRDLIRYEPGISVGGTGNRFGLDGYTIRGIGGNRVLTTLDGVRVADQFSFGAFLSATRDYVDIDGLKALEIVRGPGSALHGSDALGGVVAYRTKGPNDYLDGEPFYVGLKAGYSSVDDGTVGTVTLATGDERVSGMLLYTRRDASEAANYGGVGGTGASRERPNPQDIDSDNALIRVALRPSERDLVTFSIDHFDSTATARVLSEYDRVAAGVLTLSSDADDDTERRRYAIEYALTNDGGVFDRVTAQIYQQSSAQLQRTRQERLTLASNVQSSRWRDSFFDQDIEGLNVQADKRLGANGRHYLVAGAEGWSTKTAARRDGGTVNSATGAVIPESTALPTRDFPPTNVDQYGIYLQDEITLLDERLLLTPSVRFDDFDGRVRPDAIYLAGNPTQPPPADYGDSELSPKLGLLYRFTQRWSLYAQYAEGFRAPPYSDVNVAFSNPVGGYKTLANPDLESERSRSRELGVRFGSERGRLSLVAFQNDYDDFIESLLPAAQFASTGGVDPADNLLTFQSQNVARVAIDGVELSGLLGLGSAQSFMLRFALSTADGENAVTGAPLNSIDPARSVLGLGYNAPSGRWGGDFVWTLVAAKDADDITGTRYPTSGYGLLDLLGYYAFGDRVRLNFGLFNLTDKRYVEWADSAAIAFVAATGTHPEAARFTRPGFNAGVTLRVEF